MKPTDGILIVRVFVSHPAGFFQKSMLWSYGRIIQARRNRMGQLNLSVLILKHQTFHSMKHSYRPFSNGSSVMFRVNPLSGGFHADQAHSFFQKGMEKSHGIASASHTSHK